MKKKTNMMDIHGVEVYPEDAYLARMLFGTPNQRSYAVWQLGLKGYDYDQKDFNGMHIAWKEAREQMKEQGELI